MIEDFPDPVLPIIAIFKFLKYIKKIKNLKFLFNILDFLKNENFKILLNFCSIKRLNKIKIFILSYHFNFFFIMKNINLSKESLNY
jgi:hypothetical protein